MCADARLAHIVVHCQLSPKLQNMQKIYYNADINGRINCWVDDKKTSFKLPSSFNVDLTDYQLFREKAIEFVEFAKVHVGGLLFPLKSEFEFEYV